MEIKQLQFILLILVFQFYFKFLIATGVAIQIEYRTRQLILYKIIPLNIKLIKYTSFLARIIGEGGSQQVT